MHTNHHFPVPAHTVVHPHPFLPSLICALAYPFVLISTGPHLSLLGCTVVPFTTCSCSSGPCLSLHVCSCSVACLCPLSLICRKYGFLKVSGRLAKLGDHGRPPYYQTGTTASCHIGPDRPCVGLILYSSSFAATLTLGRHILPCMHPVTYK